MVESCNNDCPKGKYYFENSFYISFKIFDEYSKVNLLQVASEYNRDSVQVYYQNGDTVFPGPVDIDGSVSFCPHELNSGREIFLDSAISEFYYIYLKKNGLDIDTLQLDYKAHLNEECSRKQFDYLMLYYNGMLASKIEGGWETHIYADLYKE